MEIEETQDIIFFKDDDLDGALDGVIIEFKEKNFHKTSSLLIFKDINSLGYCNISKNKDGLVINIIDKSDLVRALESNKEESIPCNGLILGNEKDTCRVTIPLIFIYSITQEKANVVIAVRDGSSAIILERYSLPDYVKYVIDHINERKKRVLH